MRRLFSEMGCVTLPEFSLANGRRADVIALCGRGSSPSWRSSRAWRISAPTGNRPDYRDFCDRFYFAIPEDVPETLIPQECGLIAADGYGAGILREPPEHPLSGARRKAVTLRFPPTAPRASSTRAGRSRRGARGGAVVRRRAALRT
ncbi:MmcB family DNA repair protein [Methylobacterium oryzae CBMB20]